MECASGIIAQGINLAKVFEPIERIFFFLLFKHAYILAIPNTHIECKYIKTNVSIVEKIIRHCMQECINVSVGKFSYKQEEPWNKRASAVF